MKQTICICGGGGLGHVIAGYIASKGSAKVNILTRRPESWSDSLEITLPSEKSVMGRLSKISSRAEDVVAESDVVLLCLPGYAIPSELDTIYTYLKKGSMVGTVFSSTGFFQEAFKRLPENVGLWGLQRVPYVSRVEEYGKKANLLGYRDKLHMAVERCPDNIGFAKMISEWLDEPVVLLNSWMEAAITNSNPLLHTSRLYTMFKNWEQDIEYPRQFLFYEEWTDEASEILVKMDNELFELIKRLPVNPNYLETILAHYESKNPHEITNKIKSISGFKGLTTPMIHTDNGWIPDLNSRYFIEDFEHGLKYIIDLMKEYDIPHPNISKVYSWYSALK